MKINIMIVNQIVKLLKGEEFITYVYISYTDDEYYDLLDIFEYCRTPDSWSKYIAEKLYNYFGNDFKYEISEEQYYGDCEICGSYENTTTIISFYNKKFSDIKLYNDEHLGYNIGYSNQEVIDAWKDKNVIIDFITTEDNE